MTAALLDTLIWALIFGGMLVFSLGLFMQRGGGGALGWAVLLTGGVVVVVGVVLVFVRARLYGPDGPGA